ncbi:hypothetical protein V6O07_20635, partial [Arthrospira platensis SPKY2]
PVYKGTGELTYIIERSDNNKDWTEVGRTTGTSYTEDVPDSKRYFYRIGTSDTSIESKEKPTYSTSVSVFPRGVWEEPAELTKEPAVDNITTKRARVTWLTARSSSSEI